MRKIKTIIFSLLMALSASCASTVEPANYFEHPLEEEQKKINRECTMNPDYFGYTMNRTEYSMFILNGFQINPTPESFCHFVSKKLVFGNKVG
tara:strand:+ start:167 stop:445 length:279 start_codon:yes stop_codon:yes gene_type:complete